MSFPQRVITKILCTLAMFPPITYIGLTAAPPMPYSPVLDYAVIHSTEYGQEVVQGVAWLELSHEQLHQDIHSLAEPDTSWTIPSPHREHQTQ